MAVVEDAYDAAGVSAMEFRKFGLPGLILVAAALGGPAGAQTAPTPPRQERMFGSHIEGHIAFLKAELNITSAQADAWDAVAAAMREDVADMAKARTQMASKMPTRATAVESLEARAKYAELRLQGERRFLEAFRPLYAKLSDAQKQSADALFGREHERQ